MTLLYHSHPHGMTGIGRCMITNSDGNGFTVCYLAPQMLDLTRNALLKQHAELVLAKLAAAEFLRLLCCL
jgi:hypothetical protein